MRSLIDRALITRPEYIRLLEFVGTHNRETGVFAEFRHGVNRHKNYILLANN